MSNKELAALGNQIRELNAQLKTALTWEKHWDAEEPGNLVWNEVTGLHAEADQYKITELEERVKILDALEGAGVDNWEGYDFAMEAMV